MLKFILTAFVVMLAPALTLAADSAREPKHGGKVAETSGHHLVELVANGRSIDVYVTHDDGGPEDVKDAKASATVLAGGKSEQIALSPGEANSLKGAGELDIGPGAVVVVTLTMPRHKPEQVRFKLD
jgi:hypothetical protein